MYDPRQPPLVRTSERNDHAKCPQLWAWRWLDGLVPMREPTWAVFGTAWHRAMEVYYPVGVKRGSVLDAIDMFLESLDDLGRKIGVDIEELEEAELLKQGDKGKKVKLIPARELGPIMLREYHTYYQGDREWEVIHTEQTFQIDVPDPDDRSQVLLVLAGTWDALMRNRRTKRLELWDHKSAKTIPSWGYLELDNQAGTYPWVAREVLLHKGIITNKDRIHGIWFNYARKAPPDPRPTNAAGEATNKPTKEHYLAALRHAGYQGADLNRKKVDELAELAAKYRLTVLGEVSATQPAKRFERYYSQRTPHQNVNQARRVQAQGIVMEMMRNGELPIYKTPNHECERCVFFDLCTLHEQGDDWEFYRDEMFKKRDPYRDHREDMERSGIEIHRRK
jgi:hypothetical protein